ncbi:MAG: (Fe-S)-binding protein [Anaerolineae bacterium]
MTETGDEGQDVLWRDYRIVQVVDCIADARKTRVVADLSDDISPVFPYLNRLMPNLLYNPGANAVTLRREWRILTFYPRVAMMAKMDGPEDARVQLEWFRGLCNDTWRRRAAIEPSYEHRVLLRPLDAYLLLPRLNCRDCGEATCMAFAFGLLLGTHCLPECPRLALPDYVERGRRLALLLGEPATGR